METISVKDFVREVANETGYSQKDISAVLESAESVMINGVSGGKTVKIFKSMSVVPSIRKAHEGYNINTNEMIMIPETINPKAKFSKAFKDLLNNK